MGKWLLSETVNKELDVFLFSYHGPVSDLEYHFQGLYQEDTVRSKFS